MRVFRAILVLGLIGPPCVHASGKDRVAPGRDGVKADWLSEVDYTALQDEASRRRSGFDEIERVQLVRANFEFIFMNHLRSENFLRALRPREVMDRIVEVFELNRRLEAAISKGRALLNEGSWQERSRVVRDLKRCARRLGGAFGEYFSELGGGSVRIFFPEIGSSDLQFRYFLLQADRLASALTHHLNGFFLNPRPSVATVGSYRKVTVEVLTKSIAQLCDKTGPFLKP